MAATLTHKPDLLYLTNAGDYCFTESENYPKRVIMACPVCAGIFVCKQEIVTEEPLTLSPSVQGPELARDFRDQLLAPCGHHFWVKDGEAIDAS